MNRLRLFKSVLVDRRERQQAHEYLILKQVNDMKLMLEELIKDDSFQWHGSASSCIGLYKYTSNNQ